MSPREASITTTTKKTGLTDPAQQQSIPKSQKLVWLEYQRIKNRQENGAQKTRTSTEELQLYLPRCNSQATAHGDPPVATRARDNLIYEAYSKKKKHKETHPGTRGSQENNKHQGGTHTKRRTSQKNSQPNQLALRGTDQTTTADKDATNQICTTEKLTHEAYSKKKRHKYASPRKQDFQQTRHYILFNNVPVPDSHECSEVPISADLEPDIMQTGLVSIRRSNE